MTTARARGFVFLLILTVTLGLGARQIPRALSLYHLERGGSLLERALAVEGWAEAGEDPYLLLEPLTSEEARRLAGAAAAHFRAAAEAHGANAQAGRWLGRAAMLLDDPEEAVAAFSVFVHLRPEEPLGYWELGLAYERLARRTQGAIEAEFAPKLDKESELATIDVVPPMTIPFSTAAIETLDVPIDTPYCVQGEMPGSCIVALADWEMPDVPEGQWDGW